MSETQKICNRYLESMTESTGWSQTKSVWCGHVWNVVSLFSKTEAWIAGDKFTVWTEYIIILGPLASTCFEFC